MMARSSAAEALRDAVEAQELLTVVESFEESNAEAAHSALPFEKAKELECLGLRWKGNVLIVGAPEERWFEVEDFADSIGQKIELVATTHAEIKEALSLTATLQKVEKTSIDVSRIEVGEAPISNLIQQIIERSVLERASDLHFETYADHVVVRARVDGRLRDLVKLPARLAPAISSRIKVLAQMNIVERRRPQDGQFSTTVGERQVDIRASSVATVHGEKIVLRLHDAHKPSVDLGSLGMGEDQLVTFGNLINASNGLILVAGPTGSGKTTTLHSALQAVATSEKNVITIEDPVEYVVPGINQIPVLDGANSGFAVQLRAVLRQDPDIILVGETRDAETARISVQAALTGHLVFTSIHATDSVGALYRLLQMEIESHLIASAIRGVVSQRLIRKNCRFCSEKYKADAHELTTLELYGFKTKTLVRGLGCTMCGGSGYRDRIAAYQMLNITEELAELVVKHPEPNEFRRMALASGMTTMDYEGVRLAVEGITTLDEALTLMGNSND
ncbi:MAG: GspE/PulE family protein [Actinomycetes bacterium]